MFDVGNVVEAIARDNKGRPSFRLEILGVIQEGPITFYQYRHANTKHSNIYTISYVWLNRNARKEAPKRSVKHYFEGEL